MSTDQHIPAHQRQQGGSTSHDTEMDATGRRIWRAYGSSPGLIDLDYASAPAGSSALTRGPGSLSAEIFSRWASHMATPSSRVPMPFAGMRLQRAVRDRARGTSIAARRTQAAVVARRVDGSSTATRSSNTVPIDSQVPAETRAGAEAIDSPSRAITPAADRVARAQATTVMRATRSDASRQAPPASGVGPPLPLRVTARAPDPMPVSRSIDLAASLDERHDAAGTSQDSDNAASNRPEPIANASDSQPLPTLPVSGAPSGAAQASSDRGWISTEPEAIASHAERMPAEVAIREQSSASDSETAEPHVDYDAQQTAESAPAAAAPATRSVPQTVARSPRVPFQPLIWRKAATTWSGSQNPSSLGGPATWMLRPTAVRWPLVSRTAMDRIPLNSLWATTISPRLADTRAPGAASSRSAAAAVTEPPLHRSGGVVIAHAPSTKTRTGADVTQPPFHRSGGVMARAASTETRTSAAVLAAPSRALVPGVFRAPAVTPAGEVTHGTGAVAAAAAAAADAAGVPSTGRSATAVGASAPLASTPLQHPTATGPRLQREPLLPVSDVGSVPLHAPALGRPGTTIPTTIHQPASSPAGAVAPSPSRPLVARAASSPSPPPLSTASTGAPVSGEASDATTRAAPMTVVERATGGVPIATGTWVPTGNISRVSASVFRSPMTLLARQTASFEPLLSVHHPGSAIAASRTSLELARVAAGPATQGDDVVSSAAASPASQRGNAASRAAVPDVLTSGVVVASVSHSPGAFGPSTTFTPLLPNLLLRTVSPMMFRSLRSEAGGFGVNEMATPTAHGACDLALTIIGRNSPATVDASEGGSVPSHGLIQRTRAVDALAPMGNATGAPVTAMSASSQGRWPELVTGRPLSRHMHGGAATHEIVYVFRKQPYGGAVPDQSVGTPVPSIEQMSALPMIQSEAASLPANEPQTAPAPEPDGKPASQSANGPEFEELIERISRRLSRQFAIESERRGAPTWR